MTVRGQKLSNCRWLKTVISMPDPSSTSPLLYLLWHHQGSRSPVGQPIREYLGMGRFESMAAAQIKAAQQYTKGLEESKRFHYYADPEDPDDLVMCW